MSDSQVTTHPCVVLSGPPGSGKTTVGRALAALLRVELRDTDHAIEVHQGRSISDIFMDEGEPFFRDLERAEVLASLASHTGVLALGGGAVMDPVTAAALAGHLVVFLDVGIAEAANRVGFNSSRPLMAVNPRAQWTRMMEVRRPTYERLATFSVQTAGRPPRDIAAEIAQRLETGPPRPDPPRTDRPPREPPTTDRLETDALKTDRRNPDRVVTDLHGTGPTAHDGTGGDGR